MKQRKLKTLVEFVKECGSQEKAAREIRVAEGTLNRYLNGHMEPKGGAVLGRFEELGIEPPKRAKFAV